MLVQTHDARQGNRTIFQATGFFFCPQLFVLVPFCFRSQTKTVIFVVFFCSFNFCVFMFFNLFSCKIGLVKRLAHIAKPASSWCSSIDAIATNVVSTPLLLCRHLVTSIRRPRRCLRRVHLVRQVTTIQNRGAARNRRVRFTCLIVHAVCNVVGLAPGEKFCDCGEQVRKCARKSW